jgi:hypothetical protein
MDRSKTHLDISDVLVRKAKGPRAGHVLAEAVKILKELKEMSSAMRAPRNAAKRKRAQCWRPTRQFHLLKERRSC